MLFHEGLVPKTLHARKLREIPIYGIQTRLKFTSLIQVSVPRRGSYTLYLLTIPCPSKADQTTSSNHWIFVHTPKSLLQITDLLYTPSNHCFKSLIQSTALNHFRGALGHHLQRTPCSAFSAASCVSSTASRSRACRSMAAPRPTDSFSISNWITYTLITGVTMYEL